MSDYKIRPLFNPNDSHSVDENAVTIRFCEEKTDRIKENIRDILTNAYEERFQRILQQTKDSNKILSQKGC